MRIAVTGSIATDHLMTFAGLFHEQLLPDQLDKLSVVFLADSLEVRKGGTGANIAFGMGMLGQRPQLIGSVGKDAADYLTWLADHGVDIAGVRTSATLNSPRFTVTTDQAQNQIGSFYPGAMAEAADISLDDVDADLVLVSPNDPGAMLRHTAECRERGVPFAADPSQTLTFLDGDAIRQLVTGAAYLFTNEYEAGLVADKTGWSDAEILDLVGTRDHHARRRGLGHQPQGRARHPRRHRRGRAGRRPDRHRRRASGPASSPASPGASDLERAAQVGSLVATHVVESVGPQDYAFTAGVVPRPLREGLRRRCRSGPQAAPVLASAQTSFTRYAGRRRPRRSARASGTTPGCRRPPPGRRTAPRRPRRPARRRWRGRARCTGTGQGWPRQSTTCGSLTARSPRPARAAAPARGGSTARKRSTSSAVVSRDSDTRTLPWVSTPIATSTCDGSSDDEVHDEPLDTSKPSSSSARTSCSPST